MTDSTEKINHIFICYRREDTRWVAGRIYDCLIRKFGKDAIFRDIESTPIGIDYRQHIDSVLQQCSVVLVIVGDKWLSEHRIDNPDDLMRIEIEIALQRTIPVIPLFVQGTTITAENLPVSMKGLLSRQGMHITDEYFPMQMDYLINVLEPKLQSIRKRDLKVLRWLAITMVINLTILISYLAIVYIMTPPR
jgi:hypothetical protein